MYRPGLARTGGRLPAAKGSYYLIFTPYLPEPDQVEAGFKSYGDEDIMSNCDRDEVLYRGKYYPSRNDVVSPLPPPSTPCRGASAFYLEEVMGKRREDGVTTLHAACSTGDLPLLHSLLLELEGSVDLKTRTGVTPLHCAAGCGHADAVRTLLRGGADINRPGRGGRTAVFMAAENGHLDCVTVLLQHRADLTVTMHTGLSPLCVSVVNDYTDISLLLLSCGGDCVNLCDSNNNLPLHYAVHNANVALVSALLEAGSKRNVLNKNFESPVHIAVVGGHIEILGLLVDGGCDVNFCEAVGKVTPLHAAVNMHSDIAIFRPMLHVLLRGGCILNCQAFRTLETPLYRCLSQEKMDMSCELLSHGADPNLASPFDVTALQMACEKGSMQLVHLMLHSGIRWMRESWLHRKDTTCRGEIIQLLRDWKCSVVSLKARCRVVIRQQLLRESLETKLNQLPLPQKVRDYILLRDILERESYKM